MLIGGRGEKCTRLVSISGPRLKSCFFAYTCEIRRGINSAKRSEERGGGRGIGRRLRPADGAHKEVTLLL